MTRKLLLMLATAALLTVPLAPTVGAQSGAQATFEDQATGGETLTVASVTLPDGGFVAVHDATLKDGKALESVVGVSSFMSAGTHQNVTVHLDDPIDEDQPLIAMPHKDTDGDRIYSFVASGGSADGPYTRGGSAVIDAANVTASATVTASDHPTNGTWVNVDRVETVAGGFVTVHTDLLLQGQPIASVAGTSGYLQPGVHRNVRVKLDKTISEDQTLIAMPHRDSNDNKQYDFVTSGGTQDGPYAGPDGSAVTDAWQANVSGTATVTYDAQASGGHLVWVASTFVPDGGFVTIHDSTLKQGKALASVRGVTGYLKPGVHRHLAVELRDTLRSDDTLIAMPHRDTDGDRNYDFVSSQGQDDGPYTDDGGAVVDDGQTTISAGVHAHAQESDGRTVEVAYLDLSEPGFVTIHDSKLLAGKALASVAGTSKRLDAGLHRNVSVTLDDRLRASQTLLPMPHRDSNGNGNYDFVSSQGQADPPFVNATGAPVLDTARATVRSTVTFDDQSTNGSQVVVADVTMSNGGFVTIHDASLKQGKPFASVRGTTGYMAPGTHQDVQVKLHDPISDNQTLIAMPHADSDDDKSYDFVTSNGKDDAPYTADGIVLDPASITYTGGDKVDDGGERPTPGFVGALAVAAVLGGALLAKRRR